MMRFSGENFLPFPFVCEWIDIVIWVYNTKVDVFGLVIEFTRNLNLLKGIGRQIGRGKWWNVRGGKLDNACYC